MTDPQAIVVTFPGLSPEGFQWAATAVTRAAESHGGEVVVARLSRVDRALLAIRHFHKRGHR